jgi:hypothetical protein
VLNTDRALRGIPVVTCATEPERAARHVLRVIAGRSQSSYRAVLRS